MSPKGAHWNRCESTVAGAFLFVCNPSARSSRMSDSRVSGDASDAWLETVSAIEQHVVDEIHPALLRALVQRDNTQERCLYNFLLRAGIFLPVEGQLTKSQSTAKDHLLSWRLSEIVLILVHLSPGVDECAAMNDMAASSHTAETGLGGDISGLHRFVSNMERRQCWRYLSEGLFKEVKVKELFKAVYPLLQETSPRAIQDEWKRHLDVDAIKESQKTSMNHLGVGASAPALIAKRPLVSELLTALLLQRGGVTAAVSVLLLDDRVKHDEVAPAVNTISALLTSPPSRDRPLYFGHWFSPDEDFGATQAGVQHDTSTAMKFHRHVGSELLKLMGTPSVAEGSTGAAQDSGEKKKVVDEADVNEARLALLVQAVINRLLAVGGPRINVAYADKCYLAPGWFALRKVNRGGTALSGELCADEVLRSRAHSAVWCTYRLLKAATMTPQNLAFRVVWDKVGHHVLTLAMAQGAKGSGVTVTSARNKTLEVFTVALQCWRLIVTSVLQSSFVPMPLLVHSVWRAILGNAKAELQKECDEALLEQEQLEAVSWLLGEIRYIEQVAKIKVSNLLRELMAYGLKLMASRYSSPAGNGVGEASHSSELKKSVILFVSKAFDVFGVERCFGFQTTAGDSMVVHSPEDFGRYLADILAPLISLGAGPCLAAAQCLVGLTDEMLHKLVSSPASDPAEVAFHLGQGFRACEDALESFDPDQSGHGTTGDLHTGGGQVEEMAAVVESARQRVKELNAALNGLALSGASHPHNDGPRSEAQLSEDGTGRVPKHFEEAMSILSGIRDDFRQSAGLQLGSGLAAAINSLSYHIEMFTAPRFRPTVKATTQKRWNVNGIGGLIGSFRNMDARQQDAVHQLLKPMVVDVVRCMTNPSSSDAALQRQAVRVLGLLALNRLDSDRCEFIASLSWAILKATQPSNTASSVAKVEIPASVGNSSMPALQFKDLCLAKLLMMDVLLYIVDHDSDGLTLRQMFAPEQIGVQAAMLGLVQPQHPAPVRAAAVHTMGRIMQRLPRGLWSVSSLVSEAIAYLRLEQEPMCKAAAASMLSHVALHIIDPRIDDFESEVKPLLAVGQSLSSYQQHPGATTEHDYVLRAHGDAIVKAMRRTAEDGMGVTAEQTRATALQKQRWDASPLEYSSEEQRVVVW